MKFDALDDARKLKVPANEYFIKKAIKQDLVRKSNATV